MEHAVDPNERFRARRREARRRRTIRRIVAVVILTLAAAGVALGARFLDESERAGGAAESAKRDAPATGAPKPAKPTPRAYPAEMRGVHVTMAVASVRGKLDEYLSYTRYGLNTLELDVKDESGEVAFASRHARLARQVRAAKNYYDPRVAVRKVRKKDVYLIGRVVVFEDPVLSERRPGMAIQRRGGGIWRNDAGLGWTNPHDRRVWKYNVDVAEAAGRAGFDEIMFDYVRFPSDGDVAAAVFRGARKEAKFETIARFLAYARARLNPLGVRVSAAVFGLAATHNLGIGQRPRRLARHLDAIYPMVYPSHYRPGEYNLPDPNAAPGQTVARSLRDFRRALRGLDTRLIPWLQDFSLGRTYTLADVRAQIAAARRLRAAGFLLWNAAAVYTREALAAP